jgi:hypothetical protein
MPPPIFHQDPRSTRKAVVHAIGMRAPLPSYHQKNSRPSHSAVPPIKLCNGNTNALHLSKLAIHHSTEAKRACIVREEPIKQPWNTRPNPVFSHRSSVTSHQYPRPGLYSSYYSTLHRGMASEIRLHALPSVCL